MLAGAKGVEVRSEAPDGEPPTVPGDAIKLAQVLNNLIGNAVKFTPAGGVVRVSCRGEDGGGRLTVADSGQGIAEDMREHLFEPFHRGHEGTAGEPSTGLGLYICSRIVEGHGGSIQVEDAPEGGAMFSVWLPGEGAPAPAPVDKDPVFSLD
jgi:signal transduction histidine kinase